MFLHIWVHIPNNVIRLIYQWFIIFMHFSGKSYHNNTWRHIFIYERTRIQHSTITYCYSLLDDASGTMTNMSCFAWLNLTLLS